MANLDPELLNELEKRGVDSGIIAELRSRSTQQVNTPAISPTPTGLDQPANPDTYQQPQDPQFNVPGYTARGIQPNYNIPLTPGPSYDTGIQRAIGTNEPVGLLGSMVRGVPAMAGTALGTMAGSPAGPAGAIYGAGAGAGAGEALRQAYVNYRASQGLTQETQPGQILKNVGVQAALGAGGQVIAEGLSLATPFKNRLVAGGLRVGPNIKTKYGLSAAENPARIAEAPTKEQMSQLYNEFEQSNQLINPAKAQAVRGDLIFTHGDEAKMVQDIYGKLLRGDVVEPQSLYEASQAARSLKDSARLASGEQSVNLTKVKQAGEAINKALEEATKSGKISYEELRKLNFESKVATQFKSPFPLNLNGEPNVLRTVSSSYAGAGAGAAIGGAAAGLPGVILGGAIGAALGPVTVSPLAAGYLLRTSANIAGLAARGARTVPSTLGAYYQSPGAQPGAPR